jgi:ketosteroid isomerase-like protein
MSKENVDRFVASADAFNRRDAGTFFSFFDPEVQFEPQQAALQGTYVGHEGIGEWVRDLAEHYDPESGHIELAEVRDLGDSVFATGTLRFAGKASGIETEVAIAIVARFRDGQMTYFKDFGDKDEALEAAGLSE